ncbi:MAG: hypothetical protein LBV38_04015, partial [Alistipes sp.]|nr:hypothetical protein [Alistipes sp.]
ENPTPSATTPETQEDTFTNEGCFQLDDRRVAFIPTAPIHLGFRYRLRYTSDYRIVSRTELKGFNTIYLGEHATRTFPLTNQFPDRRDTFRPARTYTLAIFENPKPENPKTGQQYQLRYTRQTPEGPTTEQTTPPTTDRFSTVTVESGLPVANPTLWQRPSDSQTWQPCPDDWALYDGFIKETGTVDVELNLRTAPERITRGEPKFFDDIWFGGAEPGMTLTLRDGTMLQPIFYAQPTEGSTLTFRDVCAHNVSRMDFIAALRQMFNLCFITDSRARVVRIEPADTFYTNRVVDWTDRLDLGRPVTVQELGNDLARTMTWRYAGGDGAVARFDRTNATTFGSWSAQVDNASLTGTSTWQNPIFTPSINATGLYLGAPSASLVQVGTDPFVDYAPGESYLTEDLNFAPKIVRYHGMTPLPAGELWGWPLAEAAYPKLSFHDPAAGQTLCFEDRDGCTGLNRFWQRDVRTWNEGRRITARVALTPADIESLTFPTGHGADFRALYRLLIDGEECLCRLEEVRDYTPDAPSTTCVFIKTPL